MSELNELKHSLPTKHDLKNLMKHRKQAFTKITFHLHIPLCAPNSILDTPSRVCNSWYTHVISIWLILFFWWWSFSVSSTQSYKKSPSKYIHFTTPHLKQKICLKKTTIFQFPSARYRHIYRLSERKNLAYLIIIISRPNVSNDVIVIPYVAGLGLRASMRQRPGLQNCCQTDKNAAK